VDLYSAVFVRNLKRAQCASIWKIEMSWDGV